MRKQVKLKFEVGDSNYVKPGEYFIEFSEDGSDITAIYRREDDATLKSIVSTTLAVEANKAVTASSATVTVNPSSGKDVMKKATVTVPLEQKTVTYSIAALSAGNQVINPTSGKLGMSKVTITFTD